MQFLEESQSHQKNTDIEVLRSFAILSTLVSHLDILFFWGSDKFDAFQRMFFLWGGVDLFFCISGYVITGNLLRSLSDARSDRFRDFAIPFWVRRAWRIFPSAWLWMLVPLAVSIALNRSGYFGTAEGNLIDGASIVAQIANFHIWSCYAIPGMTCGVNQVYWSLSLEEQSYILLPILLFFANRRTVVPTLCVIVLAQLFLHRPVLSFLWFTRTDALALGALISIFQQSNFFNGIEPRALSRGWLAAIVLAVFCVVLSVIPGALVRIPFHTGLLALVSALMVWIASYGKGYTWPDGPIKRAMIYVGSRSYAIYLIHVPTYRVTRELWMHFAPHGAVIDGTYSLRFVLTAIPLVLVLAELNYRLVETPLRRHGARVADRWRQSRIKDASNIAWNA